MNDRNEVFKQHLYEVCDKKGSCCTVYTKKDKDGNVSLLVSTRGDIGRFTSLSPAAQEKVLKWLKANIIPQKRLNKNRTSLGIAHILQLRTHIFLSSNEIKEAMLRIGLYPAEPDALNWVFCISSRSPICQKQADGEYGLTIPECMLTYVPD